MRQGGLRRPAIRLCRTPRSSEQCNRSDQGAEASEPDRPCHLRGYLRVSTGKQDQQFQRDVLDQAGVLKRNRYVDHGISGAKTERPALDVLLMDAAPEDIITLDKLDRIGRSTAHVALLLEELTQRRVHIRSLIDGLDSTAPTGKTMLQMLAIFAELERSFIQECTMAGLAAARAKGRLGGRPKKVNDAKHRQAQTLRDAGESVPDIAKTLGVSVSTVYRVTSAGRDSRDAN